jgi:hypothetical protein
VLIDVGVRVDQPGGDDFPRHVDGFARRGRDARFDGHDPAAVDGHIGYPVPRGCRVDHAAVA